MEALARAIRVGLPPPSDEAELTHARNHIEALVRQYLPMVYRLLRQLGVPERDVDDATQQVFLILNQRLSNIRTGRERAFISAAAVRIASRWRRTHRRRHEDENAGPISERPADGPAPDVQLERAQAERQLLLVLETLPEKLREAFVLFEIEELTLREISESLGLPQGTVASRLRLARERFQASIQKLGLARIGREP